MPLPLISATPPSALRSSMDRSAPARPRARPGSRRRPRCRGGGRTGPRTSAAVRRTPVGGVEERRGSRCPRRGAWTAASAPVVGVDRHAPSLAPGARRHRVAHDRSEGAAPSDRRPGPRPRPSQRMRGSRRNQAHWRRAKARVRRTASSTRLVERDARPRRGPAAPGSRGPGGRCGTGPPGRAGQRPDLVEEARRPSSRSNRSSMRRSTAAGSKRSPTRREAGRRVGVEPGAEGGERPARPEGDLEGPDDPAPVGRGRSGRRPAGRGSASRACRAAQPARARRPRPRGRRPPSGQRPGSVEVVDHGPQVQPGAADQQGPVPAAGRCRPGRRGPPAGTGETVNSSSGSTRSTRWWGTSARAAGDGLAVPMSMPR